MFIMFIIILNTFFLCMDYIGESETYFKVLDTGNTVFVGIFAIEVVCKIIGLGLKFYFT